MELIDVVLKLNPGDVVSISKIQKDFGLGFVKAKTIFDELINEGFVVEDKRKEKYVYSPKRYRQMMEEKYGDLSSLISSYDGKKKLELPKEMKKEEFIKLIQDNEKGMNIIFLDIDGVLNCRATKDKCGPYRGIEDEKVSLIKKLVKESGARIVLISSWKEKWFKEKYFKDKQDDLANYLDEKMANAQLIVFDKTDPWFTRVDGIRDFLDRLRAKNIVVNNYVIFDDDASEYKYAGRIRAHLLQTSFENGGLSKKHIKKAIELLERSLDVRHTYR